MSNIYKYRQLIYNKFKVIEEFETLKAFFFKIEENKKIKLIKVLKNNNLFDKEVLTKIGQIKSSKITQVEEIYYKNDMNYLKVEFFENSKSIMRFLKTYDNNISCDKLYDILYQIAMSIDMLHNHNIAHFDLPYINILIDNNFKIKIIDFDLSKIITKQTSELKYVDIHAFVEMVYRIITKFTYIDNIANIQIKCKKKNLNYSSCTNFLKSIKYKCNKRSE